jgi:tetratricopeptide (TPR) repeat protein
MSCQYEDRLGFIASYVRGNLPEHEQEAFEAHYLGCDECFRALRFVEKTSLAMHRFGDSVFVPAPAAARLAWSGWPQKLKTWWDEIYISDQWKRAVPALAAYVLLVAAMSAGYYWITASPPSHMDRESAFLPHSPSGQTASLVQLQHLDWSMAGVSSDDDPTLLARLAEIEPVYQDQQNYRLAAARLAEIAKNFPETIEIHLYLGISQLRMNRTTEGITSLRKALELAPSHSAAQWYLAQGYLIQGRPDEARKLLVSLAGKSDSQYAQQAIALMEKMQKSGGRN